MYVNSSIEKMVVTDADIDAVVEEFKRTIKGSLLIDTYDFALTVSFSAYDRSEFTESDDKTDGQYPEE